MRQSELDTCLTKHDSWLQGQNNGKKGIFENVNFKYLDFSNRSYFQIIFSKASFEQANLSGTKFMDCDFDECDFRYAYMLNCYFINCKLRKITFNDNADGVLIIRTNI